MDKPQVKVKICGLRDEPQLDAMAALGCKPDCIGFVFAKSKRQVNVEQASRLVQHTRKLWGADAPLCVGVFVNPMLEELIDIQREVSLDVVQLHGQEAPELCRQVRDALSVQVWKAMPVGEDRIDASQIEAKLSSYAGTIDGLLLDTMDPHQLGGTGRTFRWSDIPLYYHWTQQQGIPLYAAGGLHAENVGELIQLYHCDGVDVSSGVETDGVKDMGKIKAFIERVKSNASGA